MTDKALCIAQIHKNIALLPEDKLREVTDYIEFLCFKAAPHKKRVAKLSGIWQGHGFEKITDLESQLKAIRGDAATALLNKAL